MKQNNNHTKMDTPEPPGKTTLVWEQEDENGKYKKYRRTFRTQEEKFNFIKDMMTSAQYLGKNFTVIQMEA